jgi:hypothetical protein
MFEIKIFCNCGTKYKFDVEPINGRMPGPVQCPVCRTDGTEEGNRLIMARIAPPEATVSAVPVLAPSAHPSLPATPRISIPGNGGGAAISIPNVSLPKPPQAPPANPAIALPVATPASVSPPATTAPGPMPVRPSAVAVPKSAPHPPLPRSSRDVLQPPQPPANPLVPKPNAGGAIRLGAAVSPEQHAPATSGSHQSPPPVPPGPMAIAASPAMAAPIGGAPTLYPAPAKSGGFSLSRGYVGAIIAGLIIFVPWFLLLLLKQRGLGIVAWGLGGFIGWMAKVLARGTHPKLGVTAAITTSIVILGGSLVAASSISSSLEEEMVNTRYKNDMAHAKEAVQAANSDADIKAFLAKIYSEEGLKIQPSDIENDQVADFKTKDLPKYKLMADGKMTKKQFRERQIAEIGGDFTFTVVFLGMFSIFSIIWLFCGIGTAYRVAAGASK